MPAQQGKASPLVAKLGAKIAMAHAKHKADDTKVSMIGDLPGGITNGIAQLIDVKFGIKDKDGEDGGKKGDYYFYAAGAVVEPKVFKDSDGNVHRVEGLRTSITEPLYETPNKEGANARRTFDDHYAWVLNEFRKLGVDTTKITPEDLETVAAALKKQQPYFKFSTWKGPKATSGKYKDKEPRVNNFWNGVCEYDPGHNGTPAGVTGTVAGMEDNSDGGYTDQGDVDSLAVLADKSDEQAQLALTQMATKVGVTEEQITNATSWAAVVSWIKVGKWLPPDTEDKPEPATDDTPTENTAASAEPSDEDVFAVGNVFAYRPVDPKTKKPGKKVEVEVTGLDLTAKAVDLKSLDNPRVTYKKVKWDLLESP